MTTALHEPVPLRDLVAGPASGGRPARRAIVRWTWRLFRREWRQQLLVLALLSIAVAATTAGLAVATNTPPASETKLTLPGSDPQLGADVASLEQRFGRHLDVVHHQEIAVPGSITKLDLRAQDPSPSPPTLRLLSGRYPAGAGEVAVTNQVAALFDVGIGDTWNHEGRALRVVGLVENPLHLNDEFALVTPGQADPPDTVSILLPANDGRLRPLNLPSGTPAMIESRSETEKAAAAVGVLTLATIGLLFVGLVAAAGFAVLAHRRLRALGMLASLGATDRHVRLAMLANGAIVGAAACVAGGVAGLAGWLAFAPGLETMADHRINRFDVPWWAVAAALLLAVASSVAAAWWPARAASRTSVVAALSNRPPKPRPAHYFGAGGAVVVMGGLASLWLARETRPLFAIAGTVAVTVGILLLGPLAIRALALPAGRTPIATRLALRDLVRYQARSAAALGAITLAVGIAATVAVSAAYQAGLSSETAGNLASNQLLVHLTPHPGFGPVPDLSPAELDTVRKNIDAMARAIGTHDALELDRAVNPNAPQTKGFGPGRTEPASLVDETPRADGVEINFIAPLYVATPALLERYGLDLGDIDPAADVVSARTDLAGLRLMYGPRDTIEPKIQRLKVPTYTSGPNTLITPQAIQRLGLEVVPAAWLFETARPLTNAQIDAARRTAATAGFEIETRTTTDSLTRLGNQMTATGVVLALGVLALTVGLIRSETANDLRTLTATGASTTTRRTLTGVTAGALALLGALLGTAGAYLAMAAWHRRDLYPLTNIPAADLAIILIGLPLLAAAGGWLFAGREPPAIARRPLE